LRGRESHHLPYPHFLGKGKGKKGVGAGGSKEKAIVIVRAGKKRRAFGEKKGTKTSTGIGKEKDFPVEGRKKRASGPLRAKKKLDQKATC